MTGPGAAGAGLPGSYARESPAQAARSKAGPRRQHAARGGGASKPAGRACELTNARAASAGGAGAGRARAGGPAGEEERRRGARPAGLLAGARIRGAGAPGGAAAGGDLGLLATTRALRPTILIGATGKPGTFDEPVIA